MHQHLMIHAAVCSLVVFSVSVHAQVIQQHLYGVPTGVAYYAEVTVGQPTSTSSSDNNDNTFDLLVDTGSANTAIVTKDCCAGSTNHLYSCAESSTCKEEDRTVSVSYVLGSWSGKLVHDTFSSFELGKVPDVEFVEILKQNDFIQTGYDGLIGLAFKEIAEPDDDPATPYFNTMQNYFNLDDVFSMQLCGALQSLATSNPSSEGSLVADIGNVTRSTYHTDNLHAGELIMGGIDGKNNAKYYEGEIAYSPLVHEKWYNVLITDIAVDGESLGLDCSDINTPKSMLDSGTSNIAFPTDVYNVFISKMRKAVQSVYPGLEDEYFNEGALCCTSFCDPANADSALYDLPSFSISLASENDKEQITVTVPPEYLWRPVSATSSTTDITTGESVEKQIACRVFGVSEGDSTMLGDVFLDGLLTVHDRKNSRLGLAKADNCPNGVKSSKSVTVEALSDVDSFCDCLANDDRDQNEVTQLWPFGGKPCHFWKWWMYVVIVCIVIIVISIGILIYLSWKKRKILKRRRLREERRRRAELEQGLLDNDAQTDHASAPSPETSTHGGTQSAEGGR